MLSLEGVDSVWIFATLCFAIGLTFGGVLAYLVFSRQGKQRKLQEELDQMKERFADYREQVTQHFMRTSDLVQEMTASYKNVYEHLATGAQYLCGGSTEIQQQRDADQQASLPENNPGHEEPEIALTDPDPLSPPHMVGMGVKIGKKVQTEEPGETPVQH